MCLGQQNLEIYLGNRWMAQIKTNTKLIYNSLN